MTTCAENHLHVDGIVGLELVVAGVGEHGLPMLELSMYRHARVEVEFFDNDCRRYIHKPRGRGSSACAFQPAPPAPGIAGKGRRRYRGDSHTPMPDISKQVAPV